VVGEVLAVLALAVVAAGEAGLIALAVFFLAAALLAVAALDVLVVLDLHAEGIGVSVHQAHDRVASLLGIGFQVVAPHAVAALAGEVQSETVAVQFQAFGFPAVALHPLARGSPLSTNISSRFCGLARSALLLLLLLIMHRRSMFRVLRVLLQA